MTYIVLRDGQKVEIAQIDTHQAAVEALAYLDESIISIEEQIDRAQAAGDTDSGWLIKARTALKHRRRARSPLQERIGQIMRRDKASAHEALQQEVGRRRGSWHRAFVQAVRASVTEDEFCRLREQADRIAEAACASTEASR